MPQRLRWAQGALQLEALSGTVGIGCAHEEEATRTRALRRAHLQIQAEEREGRANHVADIHNVQGYPWVSGERHDTPPRGRRPTKRDPTPESCMPMKPWFR